MVPYCQTIHSPTHHTCTIPSYHITIIIKDPGGVVGLMLLRRGDLWATYQSLCLLYPRGLVMPPTMPPPYPPMWVLGTGLAPPQKQSLIDKGGPGPARNRASTDPGGQTAESTTTTTTKGPQSPSTSSVKGGPGL